MMMITKFNMFLEGFDAVKDMFKNKMYHEFETAENDKYEFVGFNEDGNMGDEPLETYDDIYEYGEEIPKKDLEKYVSLKSVKEMLPVYNDVDFYKDWSVRLYKYKIYFAIQNSGWLYLFRKI